MSSTPSKSLLRGRLGKAMRRTSSALSLSRTSTPSGSDTSSGKNIEARSAVLLPTDPVKNEVPSPIAESPSREAAAVATDTPQPAGSSPLAHSIVSDTPVLTAEPEGMPDYRSTEGHTSVEDSRTATSEGKADEASQQGGTVPSEEPASAPQVEEQAREAQKEESKEERASLAGESIPVTLEAEPVTAPPPAHEMDSEGVPPHSEVPMQPEPVHDAVSAPEETIPSGLTSRPRDIQTENVSLSDVHEESAKTVIQMPTPVLATPTVPSYDADLAHEVWRDTRHSSVAHSLAGTISEHIADHESQYEGTTKQISMPVEDPFADPLPVVNVLHDDTVMPEPQHEEATVSQDDQSVVVFPLPPIQDVIPSKSIRATSSTQSFGNSIHHSEPETDERRPLLPQVPFPRSPGPSYLQSQLPTRVNVSPQSALPSSSFWPLPASSTAPRLNQLGWIEFSLPDSTVYYVHPTLRVTTDVDLRNNKKLDLVTSYFDNYKDELAPPGGMELWLRESAQKKKRDPPLVGWWIDHKSRSVPSWLPRRGPPGSGRKDEDALDMEYRYWAFLEAHPAHIPLPAKAHEEALNALTWAWTDRLLPSQQATSAPFSQNEYQELTSLLRGEITSENGMQFTRIVSRIHLRMIHWRQLNFRPNKPLPHDASGDFLRPPVRRRRLGRALVDFCISFLCLGIPIIFYNRSNHRGMDEEGGIRGAAPMLVIGACTCLVASIVLSASVTFLSLPGLDNVARVIGLLTVLFSAFSLTSTVIVIFKYKSDADRAVSFIGGEGLMIISEYTRWTVVGFLGGLLGILTTSIILMKQ
ncbi:hypothetical protein IW261DRAFT_1415789 [Armillaria novae-zelandiae]|uniref:WW domain-containing protein n=1 Tax=Armillaria novae-zelandiae TaxID=153914 RepID=A0AA39PKU7_9AGAR|nr:hypothetical protein IW261DRAFT_1415789 [Armillaria novae-zelandiae]